MKTERKTLNQPCMEYVRKMPANGIRTHARTNQGHSLESRSRQYLNAGKLYTNQPSQLAALPRLRLQSTSLFGAGMGSNPTRSRLLLIYVEADLSL